MSAPVPANEGPRRWYHFSLSQQMVIALIFGALFGWLAPKVWHHVPGWQGDWLVGWLEPGTLQKNIELLRDVFLQLIKMMIAPLVFASIVQGIAGTGDLKKVGIIGAKALIYFEVLTGLALVVGLTVVNVLRPGAGVILMGDTHKLDAAEATKPLDGWEIILHIFPKSVIDAMARGDVLQIVCFSVIFGMAVTVAGDAGKPILAWCESLRQVMFSFAGLIMKFAPVGVAAAIAATVAAHGVGTLLGLGKMLFTLYLALAIFVVLILGTVIWLARIPLLPFIRAVKNPFTLAFATANSEAALPDAFAKMERFGVPRGIVGFVLPMGYSFNLDGSTLYLAVASVFIAQASEAAGGPHFGIGEQITMMLMLMLTSKGVAAVPRASLVVLIAALQSFKLPLEGAAMILGIDAFMDMARTSVNVLGNCLASVVVARWQGEFNEDQARREFPKPV